MYRIAIGPWCLDRHRAARARASIIHYYAFIPTAYNVQLQARTTLLILSSLLPSTVLVSNWDCRLRPKRDLTSRSMVLASFYSVWMYRLRYRYYSTWRPLSIRADRGVVLATVTQESRWLYTLDAPWRPLSRPTAALCSPPGRNMVMHCIARRPLSRPTATPCSRP